MPTYEYRCLEGHTFEVFQKMSDEPVAECPECGQKAERLLSGGGGFLFKGEGFYITDYRSKEYKEKAKAETGDAGSGQKESAKKGDAAKKTESKPDGGSSSGSTPSASPKPSKDD